MQKSLALQNVSKATLTRTSTQLQTLFQKCKTLTNKTDQQVEWPVEADQLWVYKLEVIID